MYVKINRKFEEIEGGNITEDGKEVKLKSIMVNALLGMFKDEDTLSGEDKLKRWQLATKINQADDKVEMTVEDIALAKLLIGKMYTTIIVGQAFTMLEENKQEVKNG